MAVPTRAYSAGVTTADRGRGGARDNARAAAPPHAAGAGTEAEPVRSR